MEYTQSRFLLTEQNFMLYAANSYRNPNCVATCEFLEDLKRIRYLKKLFSQYKKGGELKERLVMNHLLVLYNVFEPRACTKMLFLKLEEYMDCLKPFLSVMGYMPQKIEGIRQHGVIVDADLIVEDYNVLQKIKGILKVEK